MAESLLNIAINTPIDQLTDEQKALLRDSAAALSEPERKRYEEAGIIPATPQGQDMTPPEGGVPGGLAEPGEVDGGDQPAPAPQGEDTAE